MLSGTPRGTAPGISAEQVELRSALAIRLDRTAFPATQPDLMRALRAHSAEQWLLDLVGELPEGSRFASFAELVTALGLPLEHRPA